MGGLRTGRKAAHLLRQPHQSSGFCCVVVGAASGFAGTYAARGRAGLLGKLGAATLRGDERVQRRAATAWRDGASQKSRRSALCRTSTDRANGRGAGRTILADSFSRGDAGQRRKGRVVPSGTVSPGVAPAGCGTRSGVS